MSIGQSILEQIQSFYHANDIQMNYELKNDDVITVLVYIVLKANILDLISHCNFIEHFIAEEELEL